EDSSPSATGPGDSVFRGGIDRPGVRDRDPGQNNEASAAAITAAEQDHMAGAGAGPAAARVGCEDERCFIFRGADAPAAGFGGRGGGKLAVGGHLVRNAGAGDGLRVPIRLGNADVDDAIVGKCLAAANDCAAGHNQAATGLNGQISELEVSARYKAKKIGGV